MRLTPSTAPDPRPGCQLPLPDREAAALLARADVFLPSSVAPYRSWGAFGTQLLRRLESVVAARLEAQGFSEIRLPSVAPAAPLLRYLGAAGDRVIGAGDGRSSFPLALAPFADLSYADHVARLGDAAPRQAWLWSRAQIRERAHGFLDFGEYVKCEVFTMHRPRRAVRAWHRVNELLLALCVDDLALGVVHGLRPRVTAFPLTARSFAVEIAGLHGGFQTAAVSHLMEPSFVRLEGLEALAGRLMTSACFSQKLLAVMLLQHRDAHGLCIPPRLAPAIGVVAAAASPALERLARRRRLRLVSPGTPVAESMLRSGAAWGVERETAAGSGWRLWRRVRLDAPTTHPSLDAALRAADAAVRALDRQLRARSRECLRASIADAEAEADAGASGAAAREAGRAPASDAADRLVACCGRRRCVESVARRGSGSAKLALRLDAEKACANCGAPTPGRVLFEPQERYTSFYRAPGADADAPAAGGEPREPREPREPAWH